MLGWEGNRSDIIYNPSTKNGKSNMFITQKANGFTIHHSQVTSCLMCITSTLFVNIVYTLHSLPAEVWSVVAVFREDDVVGGIGEVGVAKVVFVTPGDLTAKAFRLQS